MAKAGDDTEAEATDTTRAKTRAVTRTKTSEARAKINEGEVAETRKSDPVEITEDDAGTNTGHVIRTESEEYNVAVQKLGLNTSGSIQSD